MKKAQGLPLTTIVIAAISLLVLVTLIIFFTGGFSRIFSQATIVTKSVEADVAAAQTKCTQYCSQAQNLGATGQKTSAWCTRPSYIDLDTDGKVNDIETKEALPTANCRTDRLNKTTDEYVCCDEPPISGSCPGVSQNC